MSFHEIMSRLALPPEVIEESRRSLTDSMLGLVAAGHTIDEAKAVHAADLDQGLAAIDAVSPRLAETMLVHSEGILFEAWTLVCEVIQRAEEQAEIEATDHGTA